MKCSESWLREWVNPDLTREALCHLLTMSGFEVDALTNEPGLSENEEDYTIDIAVPPNRGDCLSIRGMAREIAALTQARFNESSIPEISAQRTDSLAVTLQAPSACPHYVGRIIRHIKADAMTPIWLQERLRRSGIRSINLIVDVTNYVMVELGQPMHAFDLNRVDAGIQVRYATKDERLTLLDDSEKELGAETLVIADQNKPLAIAGVMGGLDSSVTLSTGDIFLESAFFTPTCVAAQRQHYGLSSESAYRFERGVDPTGQRRAIERATELILAIAGGEAGPVIEVLSKEHLPQPASIPLRSSNVSAVLGFSIPHKDIEDIFNRLGFSWHPAGEGWIIQAPSHRFDVVLEEDVIEEIVRLYGYDKIPDPTVTAVLQVNPASANKRLQHFRMALYHQGFHEIVSYSFIDKKLQSLLDPEQKAQALINPITADMSVMRTNLWPGLINALLYNQSRQQQRVWLFEIGTCFLPQEKNILEEQRLAGILMGLAYPEQWGEKSRLIDFFDVKGKLEKLLAQTQAADSFMFKLLSHPVLHPGQSAAIYYQGQPVGMFGALHPSIQQTLALSEKVFMFELQLDLLPRAGATHFKEISKFPEIRRDIAILLDRAIPSQEIQDTIQQVVGVWLKEVFIFDVYQGKGILPALKSVALALIFQHPTRTLVDEEVAEMMERITTILKGKLGAELRS